MRTGGGEKQLLEKKKPPSTETDSTKMFVFARSPSTSLKKGLTDQKIKIVRLFRHDYHAPGATGATCAPGVAGVVCLRLIVRMVASYPDAWLCDNALLAPSDVNSTLHGSTYP